MLYIEYKLYIYIYNIRLTILLTKTTAAQNEDALSKYRVRGLYFLAVVFVRSIYTLGSSITVTMILSRLLLLACFS